MDQLNNQDSICLISKEGDKIFFRKDISKLSDLISNSQLDEDIPVSEISSDLLNKIKDFCEIHNYNADSMTFQFPFVSEKLKDNIDAKSYQILKEYDIEGIEQRMKNLTPLLEAGFYLGFTKFKKIINTCIQVPFFCGPTEEDQEVFKNKWNILDEDLTEDVKQECIMQFSHLYKGYSTSYKSDIESLYKSYSDGKKK